MTDNNEFILYGPKKKFSIVFESFGKFLFDALKNRKADEVVAIDAFTNNTIKCGEILEKSKKLARALQNLTISRGDVVVLISENCLENYTVTCASLFCGAQLTLVNPAYTIGELRHAFELVRPKLIFSSKASLAHLVSLKNEFDCIQTILLMETDSMSEFKSIEEVENEIGDTQNFEPVEVSSADTAIMCLSSGTTGLPKCAELSNENLIPLMNYAYDKDCLDINPVSKDTSVVILPFFHIYGLGVHLFAISHSLTVIVMRAFKPDVYLKAVETYKATKLFVVPPILLFLIRSPAIENFDLGSIRDLIIGAASLTEEIYQEARKKFNHCAVRQLYGSTELGGLVMLQPKSDKIVNVGSLLANISAKIIKIGTNTTLGPYEIGELCIKSLSVMKGYLKNITETRNSMDDHGFYHTGDVAYYDKDNKFHIVDRIKEIIKYKGFQVAPAEIENILFTHSGVKDCGVVGIDDAKCGQLPLAFIVRQPGCNATEEDFVKYVAENVSIHKQLHGGVRFIDEIPRTSSGKILRRELTSLV